MVLATHDLNLAASLCDRLVLMRDGRVLAQGPTRDVLTAATIRRIYDVDADVQLSRGRRPRDRHAAEARAMSRLDARSAAASEHARTATTAASVAIRARSVLDC